MTKIESAPTHLKTSRTGPETGSIGGAAVPGSIGTMKYGLHPIPPKRSWRGSWHLEKLIFFPLPPIGSDFIRQRIHGIRITPMPPSDSFQIKRNRSNLSVESAVSGDYCFYRQFLAGTQGDRLSFESGRDPLWVFPCMGSGGEQFPKFAPYHKGSVPYPELPTIYQNHRVLVDDANHVTKQWGSVNSRVFDAIAAGCLPITNAEIGSQELFDGRLPVYRNAAELNQLLMTYLEDEAVATKHIENTPGSSESPPHLYPPGAAGRSVVQRAWENRPSFGHSHCRTQKRNSG